VIDNHNNHNVILDRHYGQILPIGLDQNNQPKYVIGPHCNYHILFL
jgi:hypothetical protein